MPTLIDGLLDHLHGHDLALHLAHDLTSELCGDRLIEFLHQDVAELAKVLRPAALVAGLTLRITFEVGEAARPASQGWGCLFVRHCVTFRWPIDKPSRGVERASVIASVVKSAPQRVQPPS